MRAAVAAVFLFASLSPAAPVARIHDRVIQAEELRDPSKARALLPLVMEAFAAQYLRANKLEPAPAELDAMRRKMSRTETAPAMDKEAFRRDLERRGMSPEQARQEWERFEKQAAESRRRIMDQWVTGLVRTFKLQQALWEKHGGRLVLSAFGMHLAADGLVLELRALEAEDRFAIFDPGLRAEFYRHLAEMTGDGVVRGARAREVLARPPWE